MSANRLEMHNISLAFSGFQALNKVDFTLHGGSVHALTGANGAGKSTLMAVLCGTHAHYEGEVTINNLPVTIRSPRDAKQLGIHLVQQEVDVALVPGLSIAENIMLDRLAEPGMTFRWSRVRQLAREALAQLEKNYGREGAEILTDNCQDTIFGGFAPNSQTAEQLSKALGSRTVLSGSVSRSKNDPSQSLQMMERPLMMPDELKSIPKGSFVVMKTGTHPMQTKLRLFLDWGITFGEPYATPEHAARPVTYASRQELFLRIDRAYGKKGTQPTQTQQAPVAERRSPYSAMGLYNEDAKT